MSLINQLVTTSTIMLLFLHQCKFQVMIAIIVVNYNNLMIPQKEPPIHHSNKITKATKQVTQVTKQNKASKQKLRKKKKLKIL